MFGKVKKVWDKMKQKVFPRGSGNRSLARSRTTTGTLPRFPPPLAGRGMQRSMSSGASSSTYDATSASYVASLSAPPAADEKRLEVEYFHRQSYWQFPKQGVKYNMDATWDDERELWITSMVARDINGHFLFAKVMAKENTKKTNASFEGEVFGFWQAAIAARENLNSHPTSVIVIETDSLHVAEHIDGTIKTAYMYLEPEILMMRAEILSLFNEVESLKVYHVPRHCNKLADSLARWAKKQCANPDFQRRLIEGGVVINYSDIEHNFVGIRYRDDTDPKYQEGYQA